MSNKPVDESDEMIFTDDNAFRNISLQMHTSGSVTWWEVLENCKDPDYLSLFATLPHADCEHNLVLYTFSDKLFPKTLSIFTAGGWVRMWVRVLTVEFNVLRFVTVSLESTLVSCSSHRDCFDRYFLEEVQTLCTASCRSLIEFFSCVWIFTWWVQIQNSSKTISLVLLVIRVESVEDSIFRIVLFPIENDA